MTAEAIQIIESFNDNEVYKELERRTGIKMDFISPPVGQETEQFNLMISSGDDLPDIIELAGVNYPGGPDKAIDDGVFIDLTDLVEKHAPNYQKLRKSDKDAEKQTLTDKGRLWSFARVQIDEAPSWHGGIFRKDYLDDVNKEIPITVDEWYDSLKAFKERLNVEVPLMLPENGVSGFAVILSAYDVGYGMFVKDGSIKYAPIEPGYKEYLEIMNKWYEEGLVDKDFPTRDAKSRDAMATSGKAGAWLGSWGEHLVNYLALKEDDPKYELIGVPHPILEEGQTIKYRQKNPVITNRNAVITKNCEYPEEAVRWFDYAYTEEGALLYSYGIEGKTYEIVDGKPELTDFALENPDGIPFFTLFWKYMMQHAPYDKDWRAQPWTEEALQATGEWSKANTDYVLPPITQSAEENEEYSTIMADIETYVEQMTLKFIMGVEPIDKFDEYVEQVKKMNIDGAIELRQAALDRYEAR